MKVGVGQTPVFAKISLLEKRADLSQTKQEETRQKHFQNTIFLELKRANQQIAKLQSLGISFGQIHQELGELRGLKVEEYDSQQGLNKIRGLQKKLDLLLRGAKEYGHLVISPKNLDEADEKLEDIQSKIQKELKKEEEKIKQFFIDTPKYDLDEKMLKDERFREVHDVRCLSSSFADLII